MDKLTFEKYLKYNPKLTDHLLYWSMIILYIVSFISVPLFSWEYLPFLQEKIYGENEDIIFSLYSNGIFSISMVFISIILNGIILWNVFSLVPRFKIAILWYEVANSKTYDYSSYKKKKKRNAVFLIIVSVIASFFAIISIFVHLRLNESRIYYNKIFEFSEKYYEWDELKNVSIIPKITTGNKGRKNLSPEMVLEFGGNKIDIWDGAGLGSPDSETLIKTIYMINRNSNAKIYFESDFSDEILEQLYNYSTERKRNNIINVFNYLNEKQ